MRTVRRQPSEDWTVFSMKDDDGTRRTARQWHSQKEALEAILAHPETRDRLRPGLVPPSAEQRSVVPFRAHGHRTGHRTSKSDQSV